MTNGKVEIENESHNNELDGASAIPFNKPTCKHPPIKKISVTKRKRFFAQAFNFNRPIPQMRNIKANKARITLSSVVDFL